MNEKERTDRADRGRRTIAAATERRQKTAEVQKFAASVVEFAFVVAAASTSLERVAARRSKLALRRLRAAVEERLLLLTLLLLLLHGTVVAVAVSTRGRRLLPIHAMNDVLARGQLLLDPAAERQPATFLAVWRRRQLIV